MIVAEDAQELLAIINAAQGFQGSQVERIAELKVKLLEIIGGKNAANRA